MQSTSIKLIFVGLGLSAVLVGCVTPAPNLDQKFGDAVNAAKAQQTLHPDASLNQTPAVGMDGQAAKGAVDRYHRTFEQPQAPVIVNTIGIGTSGK